MVKLTAISQKDKLKIQAREEFDYICSLDSGVVDAFVRWVTTYTGPIIHEIAQELLWEKKGGNHESE
jgi:hypothetical protein